jgi:hypothetical protein
MRFGGRRDRDGGRRDGGRGGTPFCELDVLGDARLCDRSQSPLLCGLPRLEHLNGLVDRCEEAAFTGEVRGDRLPLVAERRQGSRAQPPLAAQKLPTVPHLLLKALGLLCDRAVLRREDVGCLESVDQVGDACRLHEDIDGSRVGRDVQVDEASFDPDLRSVEVRPREAKTRLVRAQGALDRSELDTRAVPRLDDPLETHIDRRDLHVDRLRVPSLRREVRRTGGRRSSYERSGQEGEKSSRVHEGGMAPAGASR